MRLFICAVLMVLFVLAGCSTENPPEPLEVYTNDDENTAASSEDSMPDPVAEVHRRPEPSRETVFKPLVPGEVTLLDTFVGLEMSSPHISIHGSHGVQTIIRFPVIGSRVYHFPWHPSISMGTRLYSNVFDLSDNTHLTDVLIHDFGTETIAYYNYSQRGLTVYTDTAAYLFDDNFEIVRRVLWPDSIPYQSLMHFWIRPNIIFNESFTLIAFDSAVGDARGVYLIDLTTNAPPVLLQPRIEQRLYQNILGEWPVPISFIGDTKLVIGVIEWEGISYFRLIDFYGNILEIFPVFIHGTGDMIFCREREMLIMDPIYDADGRGPRSYNFETGVFSKLDWLGFDEGERWNSLIQCPHNPSIWYISTTMWSSSFVYRVDFETQIVQPLISISVFGAAIIAVGEDGEIILAFNNLHGSGGVIRRDGGFAIFRPA